MRGVFRKKATKRFLAGSVAILSLVVVGCSQSKSTSEFASHLMNHIERFKVNQNPKVVFHCHPTNLIALSFTQPLNKRHLSRLLWKMQAESIVLFPEGFL